LKEKEFDATYKVGKATVNIVAPQNVTEEDKKMIINQIHTIGWNIIKDNRKEDK